MARMRLGQIKALRPKIDRTKIDATTKDDILLHMKEDNEDPKVALGSFIEDVVSMQIWYDRS